MSSGPDTWTFYGNKHKCEQRAAAFLIIMTCCAFVHIFLLFLHSLKITRKTIIRSVNKF